MNRLLNTNSPFIRNFSSFSEPTRLPNELRIWVSSLQACTLHKNLSKGKAIHSRLVRNELLKHPHFITALITFYSKCNRLNTALAVFNSTQDQNVVVWNAIIAGFVGNGLSRDSFGLYQRMRQKDDIFPDEYTFPPLIKACCDSGEVVKVSKIQADVYKFGLYNSAFIASSLIKFYLKFSFMVEAQRLFEQLPNWERDVVLWNAMINGYAQNGLWDNALDVFSRMLDEGVVPSKFTVTGVLSVYAMKEDVNNGRVLHGFVKKIGYQTDTVVSNSLIDMYGKCKCIVEADAIFKEMIARDMFSWNSILSIHEQAGDYNGTMELLGRMRDDGFLPDIFTITTVLPVCSHLASLMRGREIHGYTIVNGMTQDGYTLDAYLENAVMDMYVKCGSLQDAQSVFDMMRDRDVASWNIMIMGYGVNGHSDKALAMFSRMCEAHVKPDEVTFINILSTCSHAGLTCQGRKILAKMEVDHGVVPAVEHYTCVVDMLGRAGHLNEAYELALTIPNNTNPVVWRTVLAACRLHGNTTLAEIVAQKLFQLEPSHCGGYVLISNIYGSTGRYEDVSDMRQTMWNENVKKTPGCSWVELNTGIHLFATKDHTHPASDRIYSELDALMGNLCANEYIPDLSFV